MGASSPQWAGVTEALAHTEYDDAPTEGVQDMDGAEEDVPTPVGDIATPSTSPKASASASASTTAQPAKSASPSSTPLDLYPPPETETPEPEQVPFVASSMPPADISTFMDPTINTATIPSSRMQMEDVAKRSLPQRAFLLASDLRRHRFAARHLRRASQKVRRQDLPTPSGPATPQQNANTRGYSDGWRAAKTFAAVGGSRLGTASSFHSQYDDC
jgi:hypothetical protein